MNELNVLVEQTCGSIRFNYEEIKEELAAKMKLYEGAVFTEDSKKLAKGEVAALRKIKAAIDDKRKEVKKQCLVPYNEFEKKALELMGLIEEPILLIDSQIKQFEEKRVNERKAEIKKIYSEWIGELDEFLLLDKIYNKKWENTSTSLKSIKEEIRSKVQETEENLNTIKMMNSEAAGEAVEIFKRDLNLNDAIVYINKYEQQKAEILEREKAMKEAQEERRKAAEIERIREEERQKIVQEEKIREEERQRMQLPLKETGSQTELEVKADCPEMEEESENLPFLQPDTKKVCYRVVATESEISQIETIFNSLGILFERSGW